MTTILEEAKGKVCTAVKFANARGFERKDMEDWGRQNDIPLWFVFKNRAEQGREWYAMIPKALAEKCEEQGRPLKAGQVLNVKMAPLGRLVVLNFSVRPPVVVSIESFEPSQQ